MAASLLEAAGARFIEASITSLEGDTYHGAAVVTAVHGEAVVDARPSDVVALALASGSPIRCNTAVLDAAAILVSNWDEARPDVPRMSLADDDPGYVEGTEEIIAAVPANWR